MFPRFIQFIQQRFRTYNLFKNLIFSFVIIKAPRSFFAENKHMLREAVQNLCLSCKVIQNHLVSSRSSVDLPSYHVCYKWILLLWVSVDWSEKIHISAHMVVGKDIRTLV